MTVLPRSLVTERLRLRRPLVADVDDVLPTLNDKATVDMLARIPSPYTAGDWLAFVDLTRRERNELFWAITDRQTDRFLGMISLSEERVPGAMTLGYWLGLHARGQGITTEAARAVCDYGFDRLGLARIDSRYLVENRASARVQEKLGFSVLREEDASHGLHGENRRQIVTVLKSED